jgi:hypothetical protein
MRSNTPFATLALAASVGLANAADNPAKPPAARTPAPNSAAAGQAKGAPAYQGPTETDIRVAYTDKIESINAGTGQYLDPATAAKLMIRLIKVNFVECAPTPDNADVYACSILVESAVGDAASEFKRVEVALSKEKDVWRVK